MDKKLFFLFLFFFVFYSVIGIFLFWSFGIPNNGQDFVFHWKAINGEIVSDYPFLFHWFFSFWNFNSTISFYVVMVFFVCVVFPYFLFKFSNSFFSVFLYFFGVSLPHAVLATATFPMVFVLFFLLLYFFKRKFLFLFPLWFLASLTHNSGFVLFALVFFAEIIEWFWKNAKKWFISGGASVFCFKSVFGETGYFLPQYLDSAKTFLGLFIDILPFPIVLLSLRKMSVFYFVLVVGSFFGTFTNLRSICVAQLVCVILAGKQIEGMNNYYKLFFVILFLFWGGLIVFFNVANSFRVFGF